MKKNVRLIYEKKKEVRVKLHRIIVIIRLNKTTIDSDLFVWERYRDR